MRATRPIAGIAVFTASCAHRPHHRAGNPAADDGDPLHGRRPDRHHRAHSRAAPIGTSGSQGHCRKHCRHRRHDGSVPCRQRDARRISIRPRQCRQPCCQLELLQKSSLRCCAGFRAGAAARGNADGSAGANKPACRQFTGIHLLRQGECRGCSSFPAGWVVVAPQVMYWGLRNWLKSSAAERGLAVDFARRQCDRRAAFTP
jgi:hypothetical protein